MVDKNKIRKVAKTMINATNNSRKVPEPYDTSATVRRIDGDTVYVHISDGVDETPVRRTISAKPGDVVQVRISGRNAWLVGNASNPPTDDAVANIARTTANTAKDVADNAEETAMDAKNAADKAWEHADSAAEAASAAQTSANNAATAASEAKTSADTAKADAAKANAAATNALNELSTVQDVVGIVEWAASHSEEDMASYINSHLSLTTYGLNLTLDNTGYRIHIGTYTADGDNGVYVIDPTGNVVTFFGESIKFSSERAQYIGGDDAYIIFYDSDNDGKPDSIRIGGSKVLIGSNKRLQDVLTSLDVSVEQTSTGADITVNGDTVSLKNGDDGTVLRIDSSKGTVFKNNQVNTVLTVTIYVGEDIITNITNLRKRFGSGAYLQWYWRKIDDSDYGIIVASDHKLSNDGFSLTLTPEEVDVKVTFKCELII